MLFLAIFILALLVSLFFWPSHKSKGLSAMPLIFFFLILFTAGVATQFWVIPFGPIIMGVYWLPLLFILLIFAFLFAIPSPYQYGKGDEKSEEGIVTVSVFSWLLLLILVIAAIAGFYNSII